MPSTPHPPGAPEGSTFISSSALEPSQGILSHLPPKSRPWCRAGSQMGVLWSCRSHSAGWGLWGAELRFGVSHLPDCPHGQDGLAGRVERSWVSLLGSSIQAALCQQGSTPGTPCQCPHVPTGCRGHPAARAPSPALQRAPAALLQLLCLLSYLIALLVTPGNEQEMVRAAVWDDVNTNSPSRAHRER